MNDIVITYDSNFNTLNRLKFMIRAIENECDGYNEIFIVGDDIEDHFQGVINIKFNNDPDKRNKEKNKFRKLKAACLRKDLTDNFYWIDADSVIPKIDARSGMRVSIDEDSIFFKKPKGDEIKIYTRTFDLIKRRGFKGNNFYNNYPLSVNKTNMMNTFDDIDFETSFGYCIKSLYCNFNRLKPTSGYILSIDLAKFENKSTYEK